MKLIYFFVLIHCSFLSPVSVVSTTTALDLDWRLKKNKDGIKVYVRDILDSNLKELKITLSFQNTTLDRILDVLKDTDNYKTWVYSCVDSRHINNPSENVSSAYYKFDFPWPLNDRDIYINTVTEVAANRQSAIITTNAITNYGDKNEDVVRVEQHTNRWIFQVDEHQIDLTYFLKSNPGGKIPDWAINMAVDKGPTNTLSNLRSLVGER